MLCTQGCLKRTWLTSQGIFVRFLGVLRGEHAHCKNNGRGFNQERILHCKPVNAPFTLVHVRELLIALEVQSRFQYSTRLRLVHVLASQLRIACNNSRTVLATVL